MRTRTARGKDGFHMQRHILLRTVRAGTVCPRWVTGSGFGSRPTTSADGAERQNPDFKSIMNKQGKEILLTPKSLIMTNNAGMSIEILDEEGIRIMSDKDITLSAADSIEITSAASKLELYARENLLLQQGDTQMTMDGQMRVSGARLNLN